MTCQSIFNLHQHNSQLTTPLETATNGPCWKRKFSLTLGDRDKVLFNSTLFWLTIKLVMKSLDPLKWYKNRIIPDRLSNYTSTAQNQGQIISHLVAVYSDIRWVSVSTPVLFVTFKIHFFRGSVIVFFLFLRGGGYVQLPNYVLTQGRYKHVRFNNL